MKNFTIDFLLAMQALTNQAATNTQTSPQHVAEIGVSATGTSNGKTSTSSGKRAFHLGRLLPRVNTLLESGTNV
jgi:hypothetical protein